MDSPQVECVFCGIVAGTEPATVVREWADALAIVPINPVVDGHTLIIPRDHVPTAVTDPEVTAATMHRAAQFAGGWRSTNILTSIGAPATQSVYHLHIHVIPRYIDDGLMLPWGTTGNPHAPHRCDRVDELESRIIALQDTVALAAGDITAYSSAPATAAEQIRAAAAAARHADELMRRAVAHARQQDWTWAQIGSELGITRQSTWERWHHIADQADQKEDDGHA